jgi:hypothetical protein
LAAFQLFENCIDFHRVSTRGRLYVVGNTAPGATPFLCPFDKLSPE